MTESELLFSEVLQCPRPQLYLKDNTVWNADISLFIASVLKRRIQGEPLQYILGKADFMGLQFKVTPDVLIPRPETEILVETAGKYTNRLLPVANQNPQADYRPALLSKLVSLRGRSEATDEAIYLDKIASSQKSLLAMTPLENHIPEKYKLLDMCTGSGCIAVAVAKLFENITVDALDISAAALAIASSNARLHGVEGRVRFTKSDLFNSLANSGKRYAICLANPPYVASPQIDTLQPEVRWEPRQALDGGQDGLDFYKRIINEAPRFIVPQGFLIMEMGYGQCSQIKEMVEDAGRFEIMEVVKDYNGIDRVIVGYLA